MRTLWNHLAIGACRLRARIDQIRRSSEAGYSTETVVVTALLVALGLLVFGTILWDAVVGKAQSINLE